MRGSRQRLRSPTAVSSKTGGVASEHARAVCVVSDRGHRAERGLGIGHGVIALDERDGGLDEVVLRCVDWRWQLGDAEGVMDLSCTPHGCGGSEGKRNINPWPADITGAAVVE
jgi:hypothetical protein